MLPSGPVWRGCSGGGERCRPPAPADARGQAVHDPIVASGAGGVGPAAADTKVRRGPPDVRLTYTSIEMNLCPLSTEMDAHFVNRSAAGSSPVGHSPMMG